MRLFSITCLLLVFLYALFLVLHFGCVQWCTRTNPLSGEWGPLVPLLPASLALRAIDQDGIVWWLAPRWGGGGYLLVIFLTALGCYVLGWAVGLLGTWFKRLIRKAVLPTG